MRRIDNEECSDHIGADRRERRGQKHHHQRGPGPDRAGGRPLSISGSEELDSGAKEEIGVVFDGSNYPDIRSPRKISAVMKRIYRSWDEAAFFQLLKKLSLPPDKQIRQFSKGMKMKLAISAALSHHSRLLILDEATSGLDPVIRDEILEIFNDFTRDEAHSVLLSSHIISDLEKICDYIAYLHHGSLLFCEEKDVLLEEYGILHTTSSQALHVPQEAVLGRREGKYATELFVRRSRISDAFDVEKAGIEDIMLFFAKKEG